MSFAFQGLNLIEMAAHLFSRSSVRPDEVPNDGDVEMANEGRQDRRNADGDRQDRRKVVNYEPFCYNFRKTPPFSLRLWAARRLPGEDLGPAG